MDKYFEIYFGKDGVTIDETTKEKLTQKLNTDYFRGTDFIANVGRDNINSEYIEHKVLIIKGKIIDPKPVEVVETYEKYRNQIKKRSKQNK